MKRIFASAIIILSLLSFLCLPASASDHITATLSGEFVHPGEETVITLYLEETTVSSLGVQVNADGFAVVSAKWIPAGLMASFDMSKNKGVFSPGGATVMKGELFAITLVNNAPIGSCPAISLTVIGKNGTQTVFEETLRFTVEVRCPGHQYGEFIPGDETHSRICILCGNQLEAGHSWGEGVVTIDPSVTAPGEMTYTCQDCGKTRTEPLPQLEPAPTEPIPTEPAPTEPISTEPTPTEPNPTEPAPTEPTPTEPTPTEPITTEPAPTEPIPTEPNPTEPNSTEPVPTEPMPTEPNPTEPNSTEPVPTEPVPTEPVPTEPMPTEPIPTEPTPTEAVLNKTSTPKTGSNTIFAIIVASICGGAAILAFLVLKGKRR